MPINIDGSKGIRQNTTEVTKIPVGTTAQRPANPEAGMIRSNTDQGQVEGYDGISWGSIGLGELLAAVSEAADIDEAVSFIGRGAIVESDSNSNGHYVRWENGEQVCWRHLGTLSVNQPADSNYIETFDLPAPFADTNFATSMAGFPASAGGNLQKMVVSITARSGQNKWRVLGRTIDSVAEIRRAALFAWGFWK